MLTALDFITVYSHDFGITESNLHGDNKYRFGEFAARRTTIKTAIKQLVLDGLITASHSNGGFLYKLSSDGVEFVADLNSEYADAYYDTSTRVMASVGKPEHVLSKLINKKSIASMQGR